MSEVGVQLRGDRAGAQDPAVIVSIARIAGRPVMTIAIDRDFAPGPGGYRKARRCIAIASRLLLPIVTFIDTRGADPSKDSEAGGIAWEIAQTFDALLEAPVPVLAIVAGEGGSGGALAFAVGDLLLAYSDSTFSVIAPELAAEILWRDPGRASEAAALLKPTASDLLRLGIADELLAGPPTADSLRRAVAYHLGRLSGSGAAAERLVGDRLRRWRSSDAD